jgi:hypothetical protein
LGRSPFFYPLFNQVSSSISFFRFEKLFSVVDQCGEILKKCVEMCLDESAEVRSSGNEKTHEWLVVPLSRSRSEIEQAVKNEVQQTFNIG